MVDYDGSRRGVVSRTCVGRQAWGIDVALAPGRVNHTASMSGLQASGVPT